MLQVSSKNNVNLAQLLKGFMFHVSSLWITETLPSCLSVSCFRFPQWITETLPSCSLYLIRQVNLLIFYSYRWTCCHQLISVDLLLLVECGCSQLKTRWPRNFYALYPHKMIMLTVCIEWPLLPSKIHVFWRPSHTYHFQADIIWCDGTINLGFAQDKMCYLFGKLYCSHYIYTWGGVSLCKKQLRKYRYCWDCSFRL